MLEINQAIKLQYRILDIKFSTSGTRNCFFPDEKKSLLKFTLPISQYFLIIFEEHRCLIHKLQMVKELFERLFDAALMVSLVIVSQNFLLMMPEVCKWVCYVHV